MRSRLTAPGDSWGPLFDGLVDSCEPQTGALAPMVALVVEARAEGLVAPCEPQAEKAAVAMPHRKTEALEDTFWVLQEVRPGGIVLRDGVEGHWSEETLWHPGDSLGRSYAIIFEGREYEFAGRVALRSQKRKVFEDPEVHPPAEAA